MTTTVVRPQGVMYPGAGESVIEALGIQVVAPDTDAQISAVGWEVESATGGAQLFLTPNSRHPQSPLPCRLCAGETGGWMMTEEEIRCGLSDNSFGISVDLDTATLRPFATVNGERVSASETVRLPRPS